MKTFMVNVFLKHKQITNCPRILETEVIAEDVNQAQYLALKTVTYSKNISKDIPKSIDIQSLGWDAWTPDKWREDEYETRSDWFKGGWQAKYDVCLWISIREYIYKEPESCPTCGRYYEEW